MNIKDKIDAVMLGLTYTITIFILVFLDILDRILGTEEWTNNEEES